MENLTIAIIKKIMILPGLLIAISFHEVAHGFVAYKLGDPTAKNMGRITLNPLKHIDPVGFLAFFLVGFGWAKPVPVNFGNLKNQKRDTILVALAGSSTNFLLAIIGTVVYGLLSNFNINFFIEGMITSFILYNLFFGTFNLLPFPPLDGSKVVISFLPYKYQTKIYENERYLYLILILLIMTGVVTKILRPINMIWFSKLINIANIFKFN